MLVTIPRNKVPALIVTTVGAIGTDLVFLAVAYPHTPVVLVRFVHVTPSVDVCITYSIFVEVFNEFVFGL